MKKQIVGLLLLLFTSVNITHSQTIDLSGQWHFAIDRQDKGVTERWFSRLPEQTVTLPGSMTTNNKGDRVSVETPWTGSVIDSSWYKDDKYASYREEGDTKVPFWLQPLKYYKGAAWYNRTINISDELAGKPLEIVFERVHIESMLWVNGVAQGSVNSLGTPHRYTIKPLKKGQHTISLRVDNRTEGIKMGDNAHTVSDHTQSNWNGIVGEMYITPLEKVALRNVSLYPDVVTKKVEIHITIENFSNSQSEVPLELTAMSRYAPSLHLLPTQNSNIKIDKGVSTHKLTYQMGDDFYRWDEFTPYIYTMEVKLGDDVKEYDFGMRKMDVVDKRFHINDRQIFLRGTLECAIFPDTGYPAMGQVEWSRIFQICKDHGLNHVRFHSWCPPRAAFLAADRLGIYLQVEGGGWGTVGAGGVFDKWIYEETDRIFDEYSNHPSFLFYCYGNEPDGENMNRFLGDLIVYCKEKNPRHLYTSAGGWPMIPENDFRNEPEPRLKSWGMESVLNTEAPRYDYQYDEIIEKTAIPYVSHEIGQWCAYPDLKEIDRYRNSVLQAKNFEIFRETLAGNGLAKHAQNFLMASGKLQTLLYKTDIEAALRTKNFAGFQLLDLHDFPGQGTALVGVLNPFWESKGYVTSREYHNFASSVVPLIRTGTSIFTNDQTLKVPVEVANFGEGELTDIVSSWSLNFANGSIYASGNFEKRDIPLGNCIELGIVEKRLSDITKAEKLTLTVNIAREGQNSWDFWVYPATNQPSTQDVKVCTELTDDILSHLENGGKVLYMADQEKAKNSDIKFGFTTIFWNTAWTVSKQPPLTLGLFCDDKHKALSEFPTEYHSNYQWYEFCTDAAAVDLTKLGSDIEPIVRVIDDWFQNRSLGLIFEAKVGKGKLIYCGKNLTDSDKPEVKQMLHSLLKYMNGDFNPTQELTIEQLKSI